MKISNKLFLTWLVLLLVFSGCGKEHNSTATIDISGNYPVKDLSFQDIGGEIEYVPLETTDKVLLSAITNVVYVSDTKIVILDWKQGEIFTFSRNGKFLSHFNRTGWGGEEYPRVRHLVYDEKNMEFFVSTYGKIIVYSEDGQYKRTFPSPEKTEYTRLSNFDDETLLAYDEFDIHGNGYRTKPYLFISKKDGSIISELDFSLPKRYANTHQFEIENDNGEKQLATISLYFTNNWNHGEDFVFADMSSDTVYQLTRDKKLIPLLTRTPSVHSENIHTFIAVLFKTDKFMQLSTEVMDFDKVKRGEDIGESTSLLYDFANDKITKTNLYNADCRNLRYRIDDVKMSKNSMAALIWADRITDQNEKGNVSGELKKIAEKLDPEDNPVMMMVKFR